MKNGRCAAGAFGLGQENKIKKAPQGSQDSSWSLPIGAFCKLLLKMTPRRLKIGWEVIYERGIVYSSNGSRTANPVKRFLGYFGLSKCHIYNAAVGKDTLFWGSLGPAKSEGCASRATSKISPILAELKIISTLFGLLPLSSPSKHSVGSSFLILGFVVIESKKPKPINFAVQN